MSSPFIGEIRMLGFNFAPQGWAFCDGQLLAISQNDALFALIGTTYGGDGRTTFGLPDLRGRVPIHIGPTNNIGQKAGAESVTLTLQQLPGHTHALAASTDVGNQSNPSGSVTAQSPQIQVYIEDAPAANMNPSAVANTGGSQPHDNLQPFLCINFVISLFGIFPSRS